MVVKIVTLENCANGNCDGLLKSLPKSNNEIYEIFEASSNKTAVPGSAEGANKSFECC